MAFPPRAYLIEFEAKFINIIASVNPGPRPPGRGRQGGDEPNHASYFHTLPNYVPDLFFALSHNVEV